MIVAGTLILLAVNTLVRPPTLVQFVLAGVVSLVVLILNRSSLQMAETFPELRRLPFSRFFIGD